MVRLCIRLLVCWQRRPRRPSALDNGDGGRLAERTRRVVADVWSAVSGLDDTPYSASLIARDRKTSVVRIGQPSPVAEEAEPLVEADRIGARVDGHVPEL